MATLAALMTGLTSLTAIAQTNAVWQGGAGDWSSANWAIDGTPDQAGPSGDQVDARIDDGNPNNSLVELDFDAELRSLAIDDGDALTLSGFGTLLTINSANNGGFLSNDGTITLETNTEIDLLNGVGISGSGEIVLNWNTAFLNTAGTTVHGANHTIRGDGWLNTTGDFVNNGRIVAIPAAPGGALAILPGSGATFTNNGTIESAPNDQLGFTLILHPGTYINTNGVVRANGSGTAIAEGASIHGGVLESTGTGYFAIEPSSMVQEDVVFDQTTFTPGTLIRAPLNAVATYRDATIAAGVTIEQENGTESNVQEIVTNDGTWLIGNGSGGGTNPVLRFQGDEATLSGTGQVVFNRSFRIEIADDTTANIGTDQTLEGSGFVFAGENSNFNNFGTIITKPGTTFRVDLQPTSTFTNQGTIRAVEASMIFSSGIQDLSGINEAIGNGGRIGFINGADLLQVNAAGILTGGTWNLRGRFLSTVLLEGDPTSAPINTIAADATVILDGADSTIAVSTTAPFLNPTRIQNSLRNNAGTLHLRNGQVFDLGPPAMPGLPPSLTNSGTIKIEHATSQLVVTGSYTQTAGVTELDGGTLVAQELAIQGGTLTGSGQIEGPALFNLPTTVSPGNSTGILNFSDSATFDGNRFNIELAGNLVDGTVPNVAEINTATDPLTTQFDQANIFGTAALIPGTTINVVLEAGFSPPAGDFFDILTADALNVPGGIESLMFSFPTLPGPLRFQARLVTLADDISPATMRSALRLEVVVPEPAMLTLVALAAGVLVGAGRRRR